MTLNELKERITETLNLEIATQKSLITAVNNCIADLLSRGYREFHEITFDKTYDDKDISSENFPIKITLPHNFRKFTYLKVENSNQMYTAERINLAGDSYLGKKDSKGNIRIAFPEESRPYLFYILGDHLILDSSLTLPLNNLVLGYQSKLNKIPHDSPMDYTIPIREDVEDALVLYGVYFYVNRSGFDPEVTKTFLDRYRYYVEDIMVDLNAEDMFQGSTQGVSVRSIF